MANDPLKYLALIELPILLVIDERVHFANSAAQALLGSHIEQQDIRIALRDPEALRLIKTGPSGNVRLVGLSVKGSAWEKRHSTLNDKVGMLNPHDQARLL